MSLTWKKLTLTMSINTDMVRAWFRPDSLNPTCELIVQDIIRMVKAQYGSVFLYKDNEIYRVYGSSSRLYKIIPRKNGSTMKILKKHGDFLMNSKEKSMNPILKRLGIKSDISITLKNEGISTGVFSVMSSKRFFSEEDFKLVKEYEPFISKAIKKAVRYDELEREVQKRDLFISVAAHELRSPMTAIYAYTQMFLKNSKKGTKPSYKDLLKMMESEVRLIRLINELLQISRIRKGSLSYEMSDCDLRKIINRAIIDFGYMFPNRILVYKDSLKGAADVTCDFDKILQTILNILSNAAKYSKNDRKINISLGKDGKYLRLKISDRGMGIEKEELKHIFDPFFRGKRVKESGRGLGLGLYLSKNIMDRHEGKILVYSKLRKGTTVSIFFPHI